MRFFSFFCVLQVVALQGIEWSSPSTLFSTSGVNGIWAMGAVHPTQSAAQVAWLARDADGTSDVYAIGCTNGAWGTAQEISTASHLRDSLDIVVSASGVYSLVCEVEDLTNRRIEASYNSAGTWAALSKLDAPTTLTGCFSLHVTMGDQGKAVVSWVTPSGAFEAFQYETGTGGTPYPVSNATLTVTNTETENNAAIFTAESTPSERHVREYTTYIADLSPTTPPSDTLLLPLQSHRPSLCLASRSDWQLFGFQNLFSKFFIAASQDVTEFAYTIIATPKLLIDRARIAIHPTSKEGAAIWKLSNGEVHVAKFNGSRWSSALMISANGSEPNIFVHQTTGRPVAVWADLTAGGTSNTVKYSEFSGGNWSTPVSISSGGAAFAYVHADGNSAGDAIASWCRQPTAEGSYVVEAVTNMGE